MLLFNGLLLGLLGCITFLYMNLPASWNVVAVCHACLWDGMVLPNVLSMHVHTI